MSLRKIVEPEYYDYYSHTAKEVNWKETEVHKMLGVPKDAFDVIRKGKIRLSDYKIILKHFPGVPLEKLVKYNIAIQNHYGSLDRAVMLTGEKAGKVLKYLIKQQSTVGYYCDYLDMCMEIGYTFEDRSVVYPRTLDKAHDRAVNILNALRAEKRERERKAKLEKFRTEFESRMSERAALEFENDSFIVIQPASVAEIVDEGERLSNCLGGYAERHVSGKLHIMFLRRKSEPEVSYFAIEVTVEGKINQCHGYKNEVELVGGKPKPEEVKAFEELYQQHLNKVFAKKNEQVFKLFFKFILAKVIVQNARGLMGIIYNGFNAVATSLGTTNYGFLSAFNTDAIVTQPADAGFLNLNYLVKYLEAMPTFLILMGACWVINLILIGRLFEIIVYTVISPIPLATFAGEGWTETSKAFIKSYAAVCLQGIVVIVMFYAFSQIAALMGGTDSMGITITALALALGVAKSGQWARQAVGA